MLLPRAPNDPANLRQASKTVLDLDGLLMGAKPYVLRNLSYAGLLIVGGLFEKAGVIWARGMLPAEDVCPTEGTRVGLILEEVPLGTGSNLEGVRNVPHDPANRIP